MTREEAIEYWQQFDREIDDMLDKVVFDEEYELLIKQREVVEFTLAALRAQQEQERNDPLTIEELRQMDGEPVWISISNNWRESGISDGWCLVRFHSEDDRVRVYVYDIRHGARFFAQQDYGTSWFAYRRKTEEG